MIIRTMEAKDIEEINNLYKQFWNEESDTEKMKVKFKQLKNDPHYIFLCAEKDNKIVGTIMGIICESLYGDCSPFLLMEDFIVHRQYRGRGIGKALLAELEVYGKGAGCSQILFITDASRKNSVAFYSARGYNPGSHVGFKKYL
jgi:ribosomal protein S18 acetylase RimI-like enzyme